MATVSFSSTRAAEWLADCYGRVARARRAWYRGDPARQRRLTRPVISVGNLTMGGSGKTPVAAHLARVLRDLGHRPSILSRGYLRTDHTDGIVVVHDGVRPLADLRRAGDEPLMLARGMDGVAVVVCPKRYAAGRLAELRLGCTAHVLDDGFQHLELGRDADILLIARDDLQSARLLPVGSLREPLDAVRAAHALVVTDCGVEDARAVAAELGVPRGFCALWTLHSPREVEPFGEPSHLSLEEPVVALAGIAKPERFFNALAQEGWNVVETVAFRDHHPYDSRDLDRLRGRVRACDAEAILTTEKDVMRLLPLRPLPFRCAWMPFTVSLAPRDECYGWLRSVVGPVAPDPPHSARS